jgi:lambda family phage portal protein
MWPFKDKKHKRKFEGASKGRRTKGWRTPSTSGDAAVQLDIKTLRNRSRDLRRNNPYAASICDEWTSNVIGSGIKVLFHSKSRPKERKIQKIWDEWAKNCTFSDKMSLERVQRLVFDSFIESGEVLVRKRTDSDKKNFPFSVQVMECDHIDDSISGVNTKSGIEYDKKSRRVKYHLFKEHPGEIDTILGASNETIEVDASKLLHIYDVKRPGQQRGTPILSPVIIRIRSLDEFEDAQMVKQKVSSCFAGYVHDSTGTELDEDPSEGDFGDKIEPGRIDILPEGKTITFSSPNIPDNYKEYTSVNLRGIAAGTGQTYENMTGDYSQTNFSAGRMGNLKFQRKVRSFQKFIVIEQFLEPLANEFVENLELSGISLTDVTFSFVPPRVEMIDPTKEIPMLAEEVRSGFKTMSEVVSSMGLDPDSHFEQYAAELIRFERLGLLFDTNPNVKKKNGDIHESDEEKNSDTE